MKTMFDRSRILLMIITALLITPFVLWVFIFPLGLFPQLTPFLSILFIPLTIMIFWLLNAGKIIFFAYFFGVLVLLVLTITSLAYKRKTKIFQFLPFYYYLIGFLVLLYLFTAGLTKYNTLYVPALKPKDGVTYQVVNYPPKGLNNVYKVFLITFEGVDERYVIQGWLNNTTLIYRVYQGTIKTGPGILFQYDIAKKTSRKIKDSVDKLYSPTCKYESCIKDFIETSYSAARGCFEAVISPDGKKFACVATYTYGPEDIMIFEK